MVRFQQDTAGVLVGQGVSDDLKLAFQRSESDSDRWLCGSEMYDGSKDCQRGPVHFPVPSLKP